MNKTNFVLLLLALGLGAAAWATWKEADGTEDTGGERGRASSYRRFVADLPGLAEVQSIRIVPARTETNETPEGPAGFDREQLGEELGPVLWDLVPPARRARIHPVGGQPVWSTLAAASALRALEDRCAGVLADPQRRLRSEQSVLWGEVEAFQADPTLAEMRFVQAQNGGVAQQNIPLLYLYGVASVDQCVAEITRMQRARPGGDASPVTFGELHAPQAQRLWNLLVTSVARVEQLVAPWRAPLRQLEDSLGGAPRTGFETFDEESAVTEMQQRLDALLELASAEVLDPPNPQELERRQRAVVEALTALRAQLPTWREKAISFARRRASLRDAYTALGDSAAEAVLQPFSAANPGQLGWTIALARRTRTGIDPAAKSLLDEFQALVDELGPFYAEIREAFAGVGQLGADVESMLRTAPRDVVLERDAGGAWRVVSEGGYPASGERLDGAEFRPPRSPGLGLFGALPTVIDLAANAVSRKLLEEGGGVPEAGPLPLLMAIAGLPAGDPRGAWLPREREYGFDETAVEIVLKDAKDQVLDHLRFGAPDAEATNPPPWVEGRAREDLTTRNMAFVHSFNGGRRLAYRVEWLPRIATVRPNQELRKVDFLAGDRRLVEVLNADLFRRVGLRAAESDLVLRRDDADAGGGWRLDRRSGDELRDLGSMDEGIARRFLSQVTVLFFDGVAGPVREGAASWSRFGFDRPELVLELRADGYAARFVFGKLVRRDGKLYRAVTRLGGAFGERVPGEPYAHLLEEVAFGRFRDAIEEVEEEARLLAAGPLLDFDLDAVDAVVLGEASLGGPAPSLRIERAPSGVWSLPLAGGHPADPRRLEDPASGLLARLRSLRRAYPFTGLSEVQRTELADRLGAGTRIELFSGATRRATLLLASDSDSTLGGTRLANRRRASSSLAVAQVLGEDEFFLVDALLLPDLEPTSWLDLRWQRDLPPIKEALALNAGGEALGGVEFALVREDAGWRREGGEPVEAATVEEALGWLENLGALDLADPAPGDPWLTLAWKDAEQERRLVLHRVSEGEAVRYVATFPGRSQSYRVSPLAVDPLVEALKSLAAE